MQRHFAGCDAMALDPVGMCARARKHKCMYVNVHVYASMRPCAYAHLHARAYIYKYIYIHGSVSVGMSMNDFMWWKCINGRG